METMETMENEKGADCDEENIDSEDKDGASKS